MDRLTLEEIGRRAGVSRSTVSRVVNERQNVSPAVRRRVMAVIEETGYQPHAAARSLAGQRTQLLGLVIPHPVQAFFSDPYFPRLIQGMAQSCNANGYTLSLFMYHSRADEEMLYPRVLSRGLVDGIIVASSVAYDPLLPLLLESDLPFVLVGRPMSVVRGEAGGAHAPPVHYVDVDNVNGMRSAVIHLIRLGRRRIGHIAGPANTSAGRDRRRGYELGLAERGLPVEEALVVEGDLTDAGGYLAARRLLAAGVDAIAAGSDRMAFGALRALRERGPEANVAVVGFDDMDEAAISQPPLTTVRQPIHQSGVTAVETLIDVLENGATPARHVVLPTELVIRQSCGALGAQPA